MAAFLWELAAAAGARMGDAARAQEARSRAHELHLTAGSHPEPCEIGWELLLDSSYAPTFVRHVWQGTAQMQERNWPAAVRCYSQAIELNDEHAEVFYRRAWARWRSGDAEGGLADMERAVALHSRCLTSRRMLVWMLEGLKRRGQAAIHARAVHRLECLARFGEEWSYARMDRSTRRAGAALARALGWMCRCGLSFALPVSPKGDDAGLEPGPATAASPGE